MAIPFWLVAFSTMFLNKGKLGTLSSVIFLSITILGERRGETGKQKALWLNNV